MKHTVFSLQKSPGHVQLANASGRTRVSLQTSPLAESDSRQMFADFYDFQRIG